VSSDTPAGKIFSKLIISQRKQLKRGNGLRIETGRGNSSPPDLLTAITGGRKKPNARLLAFSHVSN